MALVFVILSLCACRGGSEGIVADGSGKPKVVDTPAPNPLGDRINPLQSYIKTNWTNGDPSSTGGFHRSHIKVYGHCYTNLALREDGDAQAQFIADHFDLYMWGGKIVGEYMNRNNTMWMFESTSIPNVGGSPWDSSVIANWIADPGKNVSGYTWDDLVLHYKWDVTTWRGFTPGWNPDDDLDSDKLRDRAPSDPMRTAKSIRDSEVTIADYMHPGLNKRRAKIMHPGYIDAVVDWTVDWYDRVGGDGFHFDSAAYENWSLKLDKTFTFEHHDEADPSFPMRTDLVLFVPTVANAIEHDIGRQFINFANMVSPYYTCAIPESKTLATEYLENTTNEVWMVTNRLQTKPMTKDRRQTYLDCPLLDWLEEGKGYVFGCFDPAGSDRGKRFSLATFYMINHQMAFYYYRTDDHFVFDGEHVWDKQWNHYVEFDVGQPIANSFSLPDFQGNLGTNRYFVWAAHTDYDVLGREHLRDDGLRVLVLVKIMARNQTEGANQTTHPLPAAYRIVRSDLSLGEPVDEVELGNNDGVILVAHQEQ
jgi:hypothetical protein